MSEQYEEAEEGYFEPPTPWAPPSDVQFPEGSDPRGGRPPLAPIEVRPVGPKTSDDVVTARPEPSGVHRLRKGMVLNGNVLEAPIGGGKSTDVWQASHPDHGVTLVKVVGDVAYPSPETRRSDPAAFAAKERTFLDFENYQKRVMDELRPQSLGDGALLKPIDMGRTSEGRIFKVYRFLTHEVLGSGGLVSRPSKDSRDPAPTIKNIRPDSLGREKRVRLIRSVLLAVWQLHRRDIVHGDIKPANILAVNTPNGFVARLIDFDNCFPSGRPFDAGLIGGDEQFFSPERADYQEGDLSDVSQLTTASDLFSLSLVLHEVFSAGSKLPEWSNGRGNAAEKCSAGGVPRYLSLGTGNTRLESLLRDCLRLDPGLRPRTFDLLVASGVYLEKEF